MPERERRAGPLVPDRRRRRALRYGLECREGGGDIPHAPLHSGKGQEERGRAGVRRESAGSPGRRCEKRGVPARDREAQFALDGLHEARVERERPGVVVRGLLELTGSRMRAEIGLVAPGLESERGVGVSQAGPRRRPRGSRRTARSKSVFACSAWPRASRRCPARIRASASVSGLTETSSYCSASRAISAESRSATIESRNARRLRWSSGVCAWNGATRVATRRMVRRPRPFTPPTAPAAPSA